MSDRVVGNTLDGIIVTTEKKNNEKSEMERYTLPQGSYLILKSNQDKIYFYSKSVDRAVITNSLIQLEYRIKAENTEKVKKVSLGEI